MRILLIITGSIAAVKSLELIRLLREQGHDVTCVLTGGGMQFVTPLSCEALSGNAVYFPSSPQENAMDHIRLSREHDLIVIAPASANFMAGMAQGLCSSLAATLIIAADKPVLAAPAMNVKMWQHPATQRNVKQLKEDGIIFCGPAKGSLACGEEGEGRMVEPSAILDTIQRLLNTSASLPLSGKKALVTTGPTREGIDPVRYLSNYSSGKQGVAIAEALRDAGAEVTLVSGPTNLPDPPGMEVKHVESAREMLDASLSVLPADIAICAAAVADWTIHKPADQKIKKQGGDDFTLVFEENPDILTELGKHKRHRPKLVIGFAAESEHLVENARVKLERKGCDWIIANDISGRKVFSSNENTVSLISRAEQENWPKISKREVGERLVERIIRFFAAH